MANNPKQCPIPAGPWLVAGRTQMMLGVRVLKTMNKTTGLVETLVRPGITKGTNGEKVFRFSSSKLI